mgnify:CR=1 FL=1
MAVNEVKALLDELFKRLARKRKPGVVSDQLRQIDARIAHNREAELRIVRVRVGVTTGARLPSCVRFFA